MNYKKSHLPVLLSLASACAFTTTTAAVDKHIYAKHFDGNDAAIGAHVTLDNGSGEQNDVAVSTLTNNRVVAAWDDEAANQLKATVYQPDGSTVKANDKTITNVEALAFFCAIRI